MSQNCTPIAANILFDCAKNLVAGVKDTIILLPFDDVDKTLSTLDVTNKSLLTNLVMKSTKIGYKVEGVNFSNDFDVSLAKGKYWNEVEQNIVFRIFNISADTKDWIEKLWKMRVMVVVINNVATGNGAAKYELLGWDLGLEVAELTRNQSDAETKGAYVIKLACDETNKETKLPLTVFKTNEATTDSMIAALTA